MNKPYKCEKCEAWYIKQDGLAGHCAVAHGPDDCCHWSEVQVDDPNGMLSFREAPPGFDKMAKTYKKTALTRAMRIHQPFLVHTSEGELICKDGFLAMDARGYLYPIAADEFKMIYREVDPKQTQGADGFKRYINE